jgi:hypothetical protein
MSDMQVRSQREEMPSTRKTREHLKLPMFRQLEQKESPEGGMCRE